MEIGSNHAPHPYPGLMTRGQSSRRPGAPVTIPELLAAGSRSFSFEFFPPKDDEGERTLWQAIRELEPLRPTFVSVTYGAGGSTRDRTVRLTGTSPTTRRSRRWRHLTCVGHSRDELRSVIGAYADAGVRNMLALRGDPPGGPGAPWSRTRTASTTPRSWSSWSAARRLLRRCRGLPGGPPARRRPRARRRACCGARPRRVRTSRSPRCSSGPTTTSAWSTGRPPSAPTSRSSRASCRSPNLAPDLAASRELSGPPVPDRGRRPVSPLEDDPAARAGRGRRRSPPSSARPLLAGGAPGLHFYTLNRSRATREIFAGLQVATA